MSFYSHLMIVRFVCQRFIFIYLDVKFSAGLNSAQRVGSIAAIRKVSLVVHGVFALVSTFLLLHR